MTYTDAHVMLPGLLVVCVALVIGAGIAIVNAFSMTAWPMASRGDSSSSGLLHRAARNRVVCQQLHR